MMAKVLQVRNVKKTANDLASQENHVTDDV